MSNSKEDINSKITTRKRFSKLSKVNRCLDYTKFSGERIPLSYKENTLKEELILEHVIAYRKEFAMSIDARRELFLYPKNECEKYKFICTTVRPTKLRYPELYDYEKCAKFISEFIEYEELNPPNEFPKYIPSPQNVLDWQIGDCFDISIVLCSLLIGAGYNAFVVYGKAPRYMTTKDESNLPPPDLTDDIKIIEPDLSEKEDEFIKSCKPIEEKPIIESEYDKTIDKENKKKEQEEWDSNNLIDDDQPELERYDPWMNKRIHAWVMLKKNKRIDRDVFIEPSTGRIYDTKTGNVYEKVDAVFNNFNFYINLQPDKPACEVDLNLNNTDGWEYVMLNSKDNNDDDANVEEGQEGSETPAVRRDNANNEDEKMQEVLDMPPPWPTKIAIGLYFYNNRSPTSTQTLYFKCTKVDRYATYSQPDGLIMRIYRYKDYARNIVQEVEYRYRNRGDKLYKTLKYPYEHKTQDFYLPGQPWHWKYVEEVESQYKKVVFYPTNFEHCIVYREEHFGKKIIHQYNERNDRVIERKVLLDKDYQGDAHSYKHFLDSPHYEKKILINKFSQKINPNPLLSNESQIFKLSYKFDKGTHIQVTYHYGKGKIHTKPKNFSIDDGLTNEEKEDHLKKVDNDEEIWQKQIYSAKNGYIIDFCKIEDYYHKKYEECLRYNRKIFDYKTSFEQVQTSTFKKDKELPILEKNIFDLDTTNEDSKEEISKKYDGDKERFDRLNYYLKIQQEKKNDGTYDPLKTKDEIIKIFKEEKMAVTNILQGLLKEQITELNKQIESFKDDNLSHEAINAHNEKINDIQRRINIIYQRSHRHITKIMEDLNELLKNLDKN